MEKKESDDMVQQAHQEMKQDIEEQNEKLEQRLYELMRIKNKNAYAEWKKFFDNEFKEDTDISLMQILLEIVRVYPLQREVIQLIIYTMTTRIQKNYQAEGEKERGLVAEQIIQAAQNQIPKQYTDEQLNSSPRKIKKSFIAILLVGLGAVFVGCGLLSSFISNSKERKVLEQSIEYLNEKYGDTGYTVDDLETNKAYLYGEAKENLEAYYISDKDSYNQMIYAISEKGKSEFVCFDNLQSREIKQALQDKINTLTGRTEGKMFWNSSSGHDMAIEDGYFHTGYDGDFDAFIEAETDIRQISRKLNMKNAYAKQLHGNSTALNGNCDYYLPDTTIVTMEERLTTEDIAVDETLQKNLEEYADKYKIQFRGIVLPQIYFEEKMEPVTWDDYELRPTESFLGGGYMHPTVPFLMMTGWYVGLPSEDANILEVQNGIYTMQPVLLAEGIYGTENDVDSNRRSQYINLGQSFVKTDVPESVGLSNAQKEKAVSIRFNGKGELEEDLTLAINKSVYGIADSGYRVFVTRIEEDGEKTEELKVYPYYDSEADIRYQDVLDGEGYLYTHYEAFWEWQEAPVIITIVNP